MLAELQRERARQQRAPVHVHERYVPSTAGADADDGDRGALEADERVDVLDDNTDGLQDGSSSGVAGSSGTVAAHIPGGGGSAVATSGCGDRKKRESEDGSGEETREHIA